MKTPFIAVVVMAISLLGFTQYIEAVPITLDFDSALEGDLVGGGGTFVVGNNIRFRAIDSGVGFNHFDLGFNFDTNLADTEPLLHGVNNAEEARVDFRQDTLSPFGAAFDLVSLDVELLTGTLPWLVVSPTGVGQTLSLGTINFAGPDWQNIPFFILRSAVVPNNDSLSQLVIDNIVINDVPTGPTPVPEPPSWLLLGAGMRYYLGGYRWRHRRRAGFPACAT